MIEVEITYGEEEYRVLADIAANSPKSKKRYRIVSIITILAGLYLFAMGIHNLFSTPTVLNAFFLITAAAAFFLAFGGDKWLNRRVILRKTRKLNEQVSNGYRKFTFDENQVTITSELGNGTQPWQSFAAYGERSHYLWFKRKDNQYMLVDADRLSASECEQLRRYCQDNLGEPSR